MRASPLPYPTLVFGVFAVAIQACGGESEPSQAPIEVRRATLPSGTLRYEVIDGTAIYQDDIIMGPVDEVEAEIRAQGGTVEADDGIATSQAGLTGIENEPCRGLAILSFGIAFGLQQHRWPGGRVPFVIDPGYGEALGPMQDLINRVAEHYDATTSIRLVPRTTESSFVRIRDFRPSENPDGRACGRSKLGRQGGRQDVLISSTAADFGCAVHEIAHAVGAAHEQSRSDRDDHVRILRDNIIDGRGHNFDKELSCAFDDYGPYDFDSILHYGAGAFRDRSGTCSDVDRSGCTIVPRDASISLARLGQRAGLSDGDRGGLCAMYGRPARVSFREHGTRWVEGRTAVFSMGERPELEIEYRWRGVFEGTEVLVASNVDGDLGSYVVSTRSGGGRVVLPDLSAGTHELTFQFTERCPLTVTRTVRIEPHLLIVSPVDGAVVPHNRSVEFIAEAGGLGPDTDIEWSTDEAVLGRSGAGSFRADLAVGVHRVTARARFADGTTLADDVEVVVENLPPRVEVVSPAAGADLCLGELVQLVATTTSLDLDPVTVTWSVDGAVLGTGDALDAIFESTGAIDVRATAADPDGTSSFDEVQVTVRGCTGNAPRLDVIWPRSSDTPQPGEDFRYQWDRYDDGRAQWTKRLRPVATATDDEDGDLTAAIEWSTNRSDLQSPRLGTGGRPILDLYGPCTGALHTVSARSVDIDGNATVRVFRVFVWTLC